MMSCRHGVASATGAIAVLIGRVAQERHAETLTLVTLSLAILSGSKPGQFAIAVEPKAFDTLLDIAISTADDRLGQFATSLRAECARYARWALHMPLDAPRPTPEHEAMRANAYFVKDIGECLAEFQAIADKGAEDGAENEYEGMVQKFATMVSKGDSDIEFDRGGRVARAQN